MANIGMVLGLAYPTDIRVEKEAIALMEAGHNVFLLASKSQKRNKSFEENVDGVYVRRILPPIPAKFLSYAIHCLSQVIYYTKIYSPEKISQFEKFCKDFNIDVLHIHDLPYVKTGVIAGKKMGIPVVADLHENYPAGMREWNRGNKNKTLKEKILDRVCYNPDRWEKLENDILPKTDAIITVVDEMRDRLVNKGIPADKINLFYNIDYPQTWEKYPVDEKIIERFCNYFVISYIGGFGPHRGIDCAIKAMKYVKKRASNIKLLLVGKRGWYGDVIEQMVKEEKVTDCVELINHVPFDMVKTYMKATSVGLVPHNKTEQTDASGPHKLFQYMTFGKPVIVSSCKSLKRIIRETNAGAVFEVENPMSLAEKILEFSESKKKYTRSAENAIKVASEGKYSWDQQKNQLCKIYSKICLVDEAGFKEEKLHVRKI